MIKHAQGEPISFADLEIAARTHALEVAARVFKAHFNSDRSDHCGPEAQCTCGESARYVGRRNKTFVTVMGEIHISRAYYYCSVCDSGFCPRDRQLGLEGTSLSPGVTRMVALVGATVSFEEGNELLRSLAGISLSTKMVERAAEGLGWEIANWERQTIAPEIHRPAPSTLYMGVDGTGVPMRQSELAGRQGKQPDGTARTREVKLCVVWSAEGRDKDGIPVRDPGSQTYSAAIESAAARDTIDASSDFAQRVYREALRRQFGAAARRVVIGDGASWIWNIAQEQFPDAVQILDRFHAKEHLIKAAKEIWETNSDNYRFWLERREAELDSGLIETLIKRLQVHAHHCQEANSCANYFLTNLHRMRYQTFHAEGLCTSSGVVEASCKSVIGARLKRSGMRWSLRGANAIIALRCAKLSGRLDAFLKHRQVLAAAA